MNKKSVITKLGDGKNRAKRIAVYVDDNFVCFLDAFTIFKYKLNVGSEIDLESLQKIQAESETAGAFDLAINYLSKYQKTEKEVYNYLKSKGYLDEVCQKVLEKVKEYKYLDDKIYVENFLRNSKGRMGINKVKQTLKQKGISDEILSNIELNSDFDEIKNIALKYLKNKEKTKQNLQKCAKFLLGRGFVWSEIFPVIKSLGVSEDESWE
ncbi:MAG: RecX family transcriptional regulator [Clostridia bacterium]|nr:RecX family transcriptional regulator [Clostridia bacterium]